MIDTLLKALLSLAVGTALSEKPENYYYFFLQVANRGLYMWKSVTGSCATDEGPRGVRPTGGAFCKICQKNVKKAKKKKKTASNSP